MKYLCLIVPSLLALWAPLFNRVDPQILGFPFFYWFQLLMIPISAIGIFLFDRTRRA